MGPEILPYGPVLGPVRMIQQNRHGRVLAQRGQPGAIDPMERGTILKEDGTVALQTRKTAVVGKAGVSIVGRIDGRERFSDHALHLACGGVFEERGTGRPAAAKDQCDELRGVGVIVVVEGIGGLLARAVPPIVVFALPLLVVSCAA